MPWAPGTNPSVPFQGSREIVVWIPDRSPICSVKCRKPISSGLSGFIITKKYSALPPGAGNFFKRQNQTNPMDNLIEGPGGIDGHFLFAGDTITTQSHRAHSGSPLLFFCTKQGFFHCFLLVPTISQPIAGIYTGTARERAVPIYIE